MQKRCVLVSVLAALCGALLMACESGDAAKVESVPIVGVLELPISHRASGTEPGGAAKVEIGTSEIRVDGETLIKLENGKVPTAEQSNHILPKLKAKFAGKSALAISAYAATPYATLANTLNTGLDAGVHTFAFRVRKPGSNTDTGYLILSDNRFAPNADDSKFALDQLVNWDNFVAVWEEAITACQATDRADCGYRPIAKAQGGKLDMMLRVRGSGIALRMRQTGAPTPTPAEAAPKKAPRAEMLDGIKAPPQAEEAPPEPSTEHVFTLRADQATAVPSPVSGIVKPLCSGISCPVVLDADGISMSGRVISLIGAAFPDGTAEPKISWVLPPG
jgi:hypothetical protein